MATRSAAPLDRAMLDSAASPTRVIFGIIFLAWSWVSTVLILGHFLIPLIAGAPGVPASYIVALAVALLVTWVEFVSAARWTGVYWFLIFFLDMPFTALQSHAWFTVLAAAYTEVTPAVDLTLWIVAGIGGIIAAIFGELLLFGRRR